MHGETNKADPRISLAVKLRSGNCTSQPFLTVKPMPGCQNHVSIAIKRHPGPQSFYNSF
jgi:hypothetical protein